MTRLRVRPFWISAGQVLLGAAGVVLLTFVCYRLQLNLAMAVLWDLIVIVLLSLTGSFVAAALVSFVAALSLSYFFASPVLSLGADNPVDWVALAVFLATALVISRLVSNLRQALQRLQAANEELGTVIDAIPALVTTHRPDGTIDFINQRCVEFTGLPLRDVAWPDTSAVHADDLPDLVSRWQAAIATGHVFETEIRVRRADGEYRWMLVRALPRRDSLGTIVKWYATGTDIQDRRQAKEELRQRAGLLDLTHDTVFVRDLNDVILYWNRGAAELYGWTQQEVLGKITHDVLHTSFPKPLDEIREELFRTGRWEGELQHSKRDGSRVVVASRWSLQRDDKGVPAAILETNNDVTARVLAEAELRESERRYRRIFQTAGVSIWEEDFSQVATSLEELKAQGVTDIRAYLATHPEFVQQAVSQVKVVDVNDATLALLRAESKAELLGSLDRVFLPETLSVFAHELIALADGRTFFQDETALQTLHGDRVPVLFTIAFPAPPARLDSVLVSIMDVSQRKRAEEALQRSEAYLAEAQRLSHTGSWARNLRQPEESYWSEEAYRIFRVDPTGDHATVAREMRERVHPEDWPRLVEAGQRAIRDRTDFQLNYRALLPDGSIRYIRAVGHPVANATGQVDELVGTVMDVTERKRTERALRRAHERTLEARFAAVLNERTRLAREIHDTLLQGFTGVALKLLAASNRVTSPPESVVALREVVALAQKTLTDARRAVWDLRTPSPPGGNFPQALRTAAEDCIRNTGLALEYEVMGAMQPLDPEIEAVALRAVQESITNVVKHAEARTTRVQLSFEGRGLRLSIADDGRGFIVDPDFQTYGGHWGLLGMRERTSQVRGKLSVRSTPGEGTEIVLRLPYLAPREPFAGTLRNGLTAGEPAVHHAPNPLEEASRPT
jgi:PAS domain S-box-containing protein